MVVRFLLYAAMGAIALTITLEAIASAGYVDRGCKQLYK